MQLLLTICWLLTLSFCSVSGQICALAIFLALLVLRRLTPVTHISRNGYYATALLGCCVPFLSLAGSGSIAAAVFSFLLLERKRIKPAHVFWAVPFLTVVALWVAAQFVFEGALFRDCLELVVKEEGIINRFSLTHHLIREGPFSSLNSLRQLLALLSIALLAACFSNQSNAEPESNLRDGALYGVTLALPLVSVLSIYQYVVGSEGGFFAYSNSFWRSEQRYAASFLDPNSCGIFIGLMLPIVLCALVKKRTHSSSFLALYGVMSSMAGILSGSRSFLLALLLSLLFTTFTLPRFSRSAFKYLIVAISFATLIAFAAMFLMQVNVAPAPLVRALNQLKLTDPSTLFYTRTIFFELASAIFAVDPIVGIGFQRFPLFVVPWSFDHALNTGMWTDNANSFYLQIAAELGLIGIAAFVFSLSCLRRARSSDPLVIRAQLQLAVLAALLVIGPHLVFEEICFTTALLLSYGVLPQPANKTVKFICVCLLPFIALLVFARSSISERGVEAWEKDSTGYLRWLRPSAQFRLPCILGKAELKLIFQRSLTVSLQGGKSSHVYHGTPGDSHRFEFSCEADTYTPTHVLITYSSSRSWIPARSGLGNDWRPLSARLWIPYLDRYAKGMR